MINFSSRLPSAYQEVEYIQSTGTQYIDTGLTATGQNFKYFCLEIDQAIITGTHVSVSGSGHTPPFFYIGTVGGTIYYGNGSADTSAEATYDYTRRTFVVDARTGMVSVSGLVTISTTFESSVNASPKNLYLFGYNNGSIAVMHSSKMYGCKIYYDGNLVRDFVPCYRKTDNVAGMYDLVNRVFYTNAGTGSFTVGANVGDGSIEITIGSFIPKHFALRRRMMAIVAPAGFEWVGWANATWEDIYNLCKAKQEGKIDAWPDDVVLGATKITTLSTAILGTSTFTMRIIGLDIDGEGVITFDSQYHTAQVMTISSLSTYQDNFYNYCNAKPYIKALSKGTAAGNASRNGAVTYTDYYVWSLSERELNLDKYSGISVANSSTTKAECTYGVNQPYPFYTSDATRKKTAAGSSTGYAWLTRSVNTAAIIPVTSSVIVTVQGTINTVSSTATNIRFSPCFAIG